MAEIQFATEFALEYEGCLPFCDGAIPKAAMEDGRDANRHMLKLATRIPASRYQFPDAERGSLVQLCNLN